MAGLGNQNAEVQEMYHFEFVSKKDLAPVKKDLISIIREVQASLRTDFTFRFAFVGSSGRNMVTCDPKSNIGYDFDVNLKIDIHDCKYTPKAIKVKVMQALNRTAPKYGYTYAEDSTRVITIKWKDRQNSRILHSCDFAIVHNYTDEDGHTRQKYIRFNKAWNRYTWEKQSDGYHMLREKKQWITENGYHEELRNLYLDKKNHNRDLNKCSRALCAEAVHEICQRHGFYT